MGPWRLINQPPSSFLHRRQIVELIWGPGGGGGEDRLRCVAECTRVEWKGWTGNPPQSGATIKVMTGHGQNQHWTTRAPKPEGRDEVARRRLKPGPMSQTLIQVLAGIG